MSHDVVNRVFWRCRRNFASPYWRLFFCSTWVVQALMNLASAPLQGVLLVPGLLWLGVSTSCAVLHLPPSRPCAGAHEQLGMVRPFGAAVYCSWSVPFPPLCWSCQSIAWCQILTNLVRTLVWCILWCRSSFCIAHHISSSKYWPWSIVWQFCAES